MELQKRRKEKERRKTLTQPIMPARRILSKSYLSSSIVCGSVQPIGPHVSIKEEKRQETGWESGRELHPRERKTIACSRKGYLDFGVNRKRLEEIRNRFDREYE
jgi:hypothetical protein